MSFWLQELVSYLASESLPSQSVVLRGGEALEASDIWYHKVFCILSSQVPVARARAARDCVASGVPFFQYSLSVDDISYRVFEILSSDTVRYRFPRMRSVHIAQSWFAFCQVMDQFDEYISSFGAERDARAGIVSSFPGLGLKQASMFLRDMGYAKHLAIIDTHIKYFVYSTWGLDVGILDRNEYERVEDCIACLADTYGLTMEQMDTVIVTAVRAIKRHDAYV